MQNTKAEVLAPAGDLIRLKAAITFGADAVYIGGEDFGMRSSCQNFSIENMKEGVDFAHKNGKKVYLTINVVPSSEDITKLPEYLKAVNTTGIDAVIVSDIGVLMTVKEVLPDMEIHISTQAGIVNYVTANAFHKLGAKRVVLARELTFEQIKEIRDNTDPSLDIEAFVHGSMCMAFSGRCLLSNYMVGRDANMGECAQPCRWKYELVDKRNPDKPMPIEEDEGGTYILNAKDMCMIGYIKELMDAGITSFKIEGRAKSEYYTAVVTNAYRIAVDEYYKDKENYKTPEWLFEEVTKVSHREYSTGFYFGRPEDGQYYENSGYVRDYDVVAVVESYDEENKIAYCSQRNKFFENDTVEILEPSKKPFEMVATDLKNEDNEPIESTPHPTMKFSMKMNVPVVSGTIIRKNMKSN